MEGIMDFTFNDGEQPEGKVNDVGTAMEPPAKNRISV